MDSKEPSEEDSLKQSLQKSRSRLNMDLIEDHLFLSGYSIPDNLEILRDFDIKYVLSVFGDSLSQKSNSITYMQIYASDYFLQDLLTHFPESNEFISKAQNSGQNVLVHCYAGISRSATIVVAFMMKKHQISYESAINMVKCRRGIYPNEGFVEQLKLYDEMGATLNANNQKLRHHIITTLLNTECFLSTKQSNKIEDYFKRLNFVEDMTQNLCLGQKCLCVKCGHHLFNEMHMIVKIGFNPYEEINPRKVCDYAYLEPQKWMTQLAQPFVKMSDEVNMVKCPQCDEDLVEYKKQFKSFWCDCSLHTGLSRMTLRFRILKAKFKIESKD